MTRNFPVNYSLLSPNALIADVLPGFRIGKITECIFYSGGFNDTYLVKAMDGQTYYLRAYRLPWRTLADIRYELDVLKHLKDKGFSAARPVPYQNGQQICAVNAPEGSRYLVLFTEAPGAEITYDKEPQKTAQQYGHSVAEMHNALDDFSSSHLRFQKDLEHFIDMPLKNVAPFLKHRPKDWTFFQKFSEKVRKSIMNLPVEELEQGFCHGDLQGYHANIARDGTLTFFDFDCGGYSYRAYDLAVFLWCCRLENATESRWKPFLKAYRETRTISDLDIQAVPLFVCCRYLWHMGVHARNAPIWGFSRLNEEYFNVHLTRLHHAEKDHLDNTRKSVQQDR